jgi:hypothetical protein
MGLRPFAAVLVLSIALLTLGAAPPTSEPANADEKDIRRLLEVSGTAKLSEQMFDQMVISMSQNMRDIPPEFWEGFRKEVDLNELLDKIVPVYSKHFTPDEVKQLIQFYESPVGRKLVQEQPALVAESMKIGESWGRGVGERVARRLHEKGLLK